MEPPLGSRLHYSTYYVVTEGLIFMLTKCEIEILSNPQFYLQKQYLYPDTTWSLGTDAY